MNLRSAAGGRFALCSARTQSAAALRYMAASQVPIELRGAGQSSRQVRNFGTPGALDSAEIIACEVITPAGNWSSYPARSTTRRLRPSRSWKRSTTSKSLRAGRPTGLWVHADVVSPAHEIEVLEEVRDRDTVLVPFGWHGPCVAAPGFDMYYLNVMAGPGAQRVWKISDHPDQAWVRSTWETQSVDPRLLPQTGEEA